MTELATRIDRVTVYRNGALVVRAGALPRPESWPAPVTLGGLPLLYRSDSVRVRVLAPGVSAGPVEELAELDWSPEVKAEDERLRDQLALDRQALLEEQSAWEALAGFYDGLVLPESLDLSPRARPRLPDLSAWTALTDLGSAGREEVGAAREALRRRIRATDEALAQVEARLKLRVQDGQARYTRGLRFTLNGACQADTLPLEVEYFVSAARWAPSYHLAIGADGEARLRLLAWVAQATGEDWTDVAVSVSTADLRRETTLPRLPAWKIGRAAPPQTSSWRPLPEDLEGLFRDYDQTPSVRPEAPKARPPPPPPVRAAETAAPAAPDVDPPATAFFAVPAPKIENRRDVPLRPAAAAAPPPAPMAPPQAMPARAKGVSVVARAAGVAADLLEGAGGALGSAPPDGGPPGAPPPPPPLNPGRLLDYAWLRLPPWDRRGERGRLMPVDLWSDLRTLADERGDPERYAEIERALKALRAALAALGRLPMPPGCVGLEASSFLYRYPAGPRVSLASDGQFHQIAIAQGQGPARALFRVVPRQAPLVYRYAQLTNPLGAPLPRGPLRATLLGDARPTAELQATGASGALMLNLGLEEGLRVARNATYQESEKGVLSQVTQGVHSVRVEIANNLAEPATVQIWERLPLPPEGADLSVTLDQATPAPTRDLDPDNQECKGALRWELTVPAQGKAEVRYTYTLKVPSKMEIVGGGRREP